MNTPPFGVKDSDFSFPQPPSPPDFDWVDELVVGLSEEELQEFPLDPLVDIDQLLLDLEQPVQELQEGPKEKPELEKIQARLHCIAQEESNIPVTVTALQIPKRESESCLPKRVQRQWKDWETPVQQRRGFQYPEGYWKERSLGQTRARPCCDLAVRQETTEQPKLPEAPALYQKYKSAHTDKEIAERNKLVEYIRTLQSLTTVFKVKLSKLVKAQTDCPKQPVCGIRAKHYHGAQTSTEVPHRSIQNATVKASHEPAVPCAIPVDEPHRCAHTHTANSTHSTAKHNTHPTHKHNTRKASGKERSESRKKTPLLQTPTHTGRRDSKQKVAERHRSREDGTANRPHHSAERGTKPQERKRKSEEEHKSPKRGRVDYNRPPKTWHRR